MASVIDSCKDILGERVSFLKLAILTIPVYYSYVIFKSVTNNDYSGFWIFAGISAFFILGYIIEITNNVINERNIVLPALNPFLMMFSALKGVIGLAPVFLISSWLAIYASSFVNVNPWFDWVLKTLIWLIAVSFIGTSFLMFSSRENIIDALNVKILWQKSGDFIIASIFYIVQFFLVNLVSAGFIGYTIFILFGYSVFFDVFVAFVVTFNLAALGHFLGQAYYELIGYGNQQKI